MKHLPQYVTLITAAMTAYTIGTEFIAAEDELQKFAAYMLQEIRRIT